MRRLFALLAALMLLGGCNLAGSTADLLRPPNMTGSQRALTDALTLGTGFPEVTLRFPQQGEYLSAFIAYRPYESGEEEHMLAFYEIAGDGAAGDGALMMAMLSQQNGRWVVSAQLPPPSRGLAAIDFVRFLPLEEPGVRNVLVGWASARGDRRALGLYRFEGGALGEMRSFDYVECAHADVDGDGRHELFLITAQAQLQMIRREADTLYIAAAEDLPAMDSCRQLLVGELTEGLPALFIDYTVQVSDGARLDTQVIAVDTERLTGAPLTGLDPYEWGFYGTFVRPEDAALCEDIDGDGSVDIPTVTTLPGYSEGEPAGGMWATDYVGVEAGGGFRVVMQAVVNARAGYRFELPAYWRDASGALRITVYSDAFIDEWSFYADRGGQEASFAEAPLLRIRVLSERDSAADLEAQGYFYLAGKGLFRYYALIPEASAATGLGVGRDAVQALFRLR